MKKNVSFLAFSPLRHDNLQQIFGQSYRTNHPLCRRNWWKGGVGEDRCLWDVCVRFLKIICIHRVSLRVGGSTEKTCSLVTKTTNWWFHSDFVLFACEFSASMRSPARNNFEPWRKVWTLWLGAPIGSKRLPHVEEQYMYVCVYVSIYCMYCNILYVYIHSLLKD